jgi:hypothetical protein
MKNHSARAKNSLQVKYGPKLFAQKFSVDFLHSLAYQWFQQLGRADRISR